jgi:GrpB-like predicted nucleotidyltransferase (UPF0157 family)
MEEKKVDEEIIVSSYCSGWPTKYALESEKIRTLLKELSPDVEHFGSTAVPGMLAKPVIDILIGVDKLPPPPTVIQELQSLGYEYLEEAGVPGRYYFRKRGEEQNFNVALVKRNGSLWRDNIAVRNHLRTCNADAKEYASLKQKIHQRGVHTLLAYSESKAAFMQSLLLKARSNGEL